MQWTHIVLKEVTYSKDNTLELNISGKSVNLQTSNINNTYKFEKESVREGHATEETCKIVRSMSCSKVIGVTQRTRTCTICQKMTMKKKCKYTENKITINFIKKKP
ncbi:hypothetical protein MAR_024164 [Mya arenaria]|uniref:Uncharacterized protein n=1 Tax=Mya arenaria TaxID=6604 RepID=A0ABY7DSF3_MYAAR|nr:hypothetical protein MAR_024164 [Mya arenaria]